MSGHSVTIQITSTGQVEQIELSEDAVAVLVDGTPAESVAKVKRFIESQLDANIQANRSKIMARWIELNVTSSS